MKIFSPKNITITVNDMILNGFGNKQFIEFEQDEPNFKKEVSGDGEATFVASMDKTGKLTIGMKNNSSMAVALYETIKRQIENNEPVSIFVKDRNIGMSKNFQGFIEKSPKYSGGIAPADEDFTFLCEKVERDYEGKAVLKGIANANYLVNSLKEQGKRALLEAVGAIFGQG